MPDIKSRIDGKKLFLGVFFSLGGSMLILLSSITLPLESIVRIILGIIIVMQGTVFIWSATEGLREKRKEKLKTKDIKE